VLAVATALVHVTSAHGDRVGALVLTNDGVRRIPPRTGRDAALTLQHILVTTPRTPDGTAPTVADALTSLVRLSRPPRSRRGAVRPARPGDTGR
jgi:uncharacterized protein (DUF58 family)